VFFLIKSCPIKVVLTLFEIAQKSIELNFHNPIRQYRKYSQWKFEYFFFEKTAVESFYFELKITLPKK
jgi:hypothetical protein